MGHHLVRIPSPSEDSHNPMMRVWLDPLIIMSQWEWIPRVWITMDHYSQWYGYYYGYCYGYYYGYVLLWLYYQLREKKTVPKHQPVYITLWCSMYKVYIYLHIWRAYGSTRSVTGVWCGGCRVPSHTVFGYVWIQRVYDVYPLVN